MVFYRKRKWEKFVVPLYEIDLIKAAISLSIENEIFINSKIINIIINYDNIVTQCEICNHYLNSPYI